MAQHGLGILEEQLATISRSRPGEPPPLDDVHNLSTTVTELPPHVLEALRTPEVRADDDPPHPPRRSTSSTSSTWEGGAGLVDLSERSDADEPMTLELDTVMLDMALLPPLAELPAPAELPPDEAPPQTIELHVVRRTGPLAAVETELSRLPRPWLVGGAVIAVLSAGGVLAMFCWTLAELVF